MSTLNPAEHVTPNTPSSWKGGCDGHAHLVGERDQQECPGPGTPACTLHADGPYAILAQALWEKPNCALLQIWKRCHEVSWVLPCSASSVAGFLPLEIIFALP